MTEKQMTISREQLKVAANYLVEAREYATLRREVESIVANWTHRRVYFGGDKAVLNPLISVGVQAPHKLQQLWGVINAKRMELPRFKRNEYQRAYMLSHRRRLAIARQIEEVTEGRVLTPEEWRKRKVALHSAWAKQKASYLKAKGELSWTERNAAANQFWCDLEEALMNMLRDLRDKPRRVAPKAVRHSQPARSERTHSRVQTRPAGRA